MNICLAREMISREHRIDSESRMVRTAPEGYKDQPDFINGAFLIETALDENELEVYLKGVEGRLGRERGGHPCGPRTIDLDIVVFNGKVVGPDFDRYEFVRNAVLELCPWLDGGNCEK